MSQQGSALDIAIVVVVAVSEFFILCSSLYIIYYRSSYLPFRCKSLRLFFISVAGALIWTMSILIVNQHVETPNMTKEACIYWIYWIQMLLGQNVYVFALAVRSIRLYFILVRRQLLPRKTYVYVFLLMVPSIVVCIIASASDSADVENNICVVANEQWLAVLVFFLMIPYVLLLVFSWLTRSIRKEFNEHQVALIGGVNSVIFSVVALFIILFDLRKELYGRAIITLMILANVQYYYWSTIGRSLWAHLTNDATYLQMYQNLQRSSNPFFFGSRLDDLLRDDVWRQTFKEYAESKFCVENVEFWEALLIREDMLVHQSHEVRQHTQHIIDVFIRPSSLKEINISADVREGILSNANLFDPLLFSRAKEQIFHLLNANLFRSYVADKSYREWHAAEHNTRIENDLLRNQGIIGRQSRTSITRQIQGEGSGGLEL